MQTRTKGGSAETEEKALTVKPNSPADPAVVTSVTGVTAYRIASTKLSATMFLGLCERFGIILLTC
jgi:hypothetical protein